ncbi:hypothetical protein [Nocardiopsis alba]|uniref:hypothetical protein n=1 Tax=Nocardiopsis alba TaxID=53437 RepID=UPI0035DB05A6
MGILDASRGPVDDPARYVAAAIRRAPDVSRFLPTPTPGGTGAEAFLDDAPAPPPPSAPSMETAECGHERVVGDTVPCWVCSQTGPGRPALTVHQGGAQGDGDARAPLHTVDELGRPDAHAWADHARALLAEAVDE